MVPQQPAKSADQGTAPHSVVSAGKFVPSDKEFLGLIAAVLACAVFGAVEMLVVEVVSAIQDMLSATPNGPSSLSDDSIWDFLNNFVYFGFAAVAFGAGGAVALAVCVFVGIPAHLLLVWRRVRSLKAYLIAGLLAGAAVSTGFAVVPGIRSLFLELGIITIPDFLLCGPLAAGVFWGVVRPDRPPGKSTA